MKKIIPFLTAALAAVALGACGGNDKPDEPSYKKPTDTKEWTECLDSTLAAIGKTDLFPGPAGGGEINPDVTPSEGGRVELTTKQTLASGNVATIEWDYEYDKAKVEYEFAGDDSHKILEFKHELKGGADQYFNFTIKRIIIGEYALETADLEALYKTLLEDQTENLKYVVTLHPYTYKYESLKIADINKLNTAGDGYDAIDYTKDSPYFRTIEEQPYRYCSIKGKVIYMAETMNWGILADGDEMTEVYFGSDDASRAKYFPGLKVGKYCEVVGNLGQYKGNFQFSFIQRAHEISDHSMIAEPGAYKKYDAAAISALELASGNHEYVIAGMFNSLGEVTGTYKAGSLKAGSKTVDSITTNQRYSFIMMVGGKEMSISYDYHIGKNAKGEDESFFLDKLKSVVADSTTEHTIKGTMRYEGKDVSPKKGKGEGKWALVPFFPEDIK